MKFIYFPKFNDLFVSNLNKTKYHIMCVCVCVCVSHRNQEKYFFKNTSLLNIVICQSIVYIVDIFVLKYFDVKISIFFLSKI